MSLAEGLAVQVTLFCFGEHLAQTGADELEAFVAATFGGTCGDF